jgi:hypothetical protein
MKVDANGFRFGGKCGEVARRFDQRAQSTADGLPLKRVAECHDASFQSDEQATYKNGSIIAAMKILEALHNGVLTPSFARFPFAS